MIGAAWGVIFGQSVFYVVGFYLWLSIGFLIDNIYFCKNVA